MSDFREIKKYLGKRVIVINNTAISPYPREVRILAVSKDEQWFKYCDVLSGVRSWDACKSFSIVEIKYRTLYERIFR